MLMLLAFAAMCFAFARELAGGSALGRFLAVFLALFWVPRVFIQLFYYDPEVKRKHRVAHVFFTLCFVYLAVVFVIAALAGFDGAPALAVRAPSDAAQVFSVLLWLAGIGHFCILPASFQVPFRLRWREDLAQLMPFNRKLLWVHGGFAIGTIIAFGALTLVLHDELLRGDRAALGLAALIGVYWTARVIVDFAYYRHDDWPPGKAFVIGHVLLTGLFLALAATYLGLIAWHFHAA
jgi:alginate O-acetyltransferase complex protein AlgI